MRFIHFFVACFLIAFIPYLPAQEPFVLNPYGHAELQLLGTNGKVRALLHNTGYLQLNGKTSGALKLTTADATAYTVTVSAAAQTSAAATLTIPNLGGVAGTVSVLRSEVVAATNTITAAESGSVFFLSNATEFNSVLPAPALGLRYTFIVSAAPSGANYTITANGSGAGNDIIKGLAVCAANAAGDFGTADDTVSFVSAQSVAGDRVEFWTDGTSWFAHGFCSVAAGITFTDAD